MTRFGKLEPGMIFLVDAVPPLQGGEPKRRPVIVFGEYEDGAVLVVGITTDRSDPFRVDLPNLQDEPGATTGLKERCCAIPQWLCVMDRSKLTSEMYLGSLPRVTWDQLEAAIEDIE